MLKLIAVLLLLCVRIAYAQTPMPARLEFSFENYIPHLILNGSQSGVVEFELPESGEFSGEANLVDKFNPQFPMKECTLTRTIHNHHLKISGNRDGQQIKLRLTHNPGVFKLVCIFEDGRRVIKPEFPISALEWPGPFHATLYVADKATRTLPMFLGNGTITLRLACPLTVQRPTPRTINMSPALGQNPWPLVKDNTKTSAQIQALKVTSNTGGASLGLTVFKGPKIEVDKLFQKAQFGEGWCVSIGALTINYEPIRMFIASKYQPKSCQYKAIETHENLHYQDISVLARESQIRMKEAWIAARLPSKEQPWYVKDEAEADRLIDSVVTQSFKPITSKLKDQGQAKAAERDTPGNVDAVLRQCLNW